MRAKIDLNCDLGEGAGCDAELMRSVTSANIACGAHAGNLETMIETIELAAKRRVAVGAHPGFFDLENFGRVERPLAPEEASRLVLMQIEQFFEIAGSAMRHVKLHGALYNQVARTPALAEAVVGDLARLWPELVVFVLAGSVFARVARSRGLRVAEEVFADRTYQPDGSLTPRAQPNALIGDPLVASAQVVRLVREGVVRAVDGTEVALQADTVCVHGDGPRAAEFARVLRTELKNAKITVKTFGT
ncbi:MAG TPA: 5-oxoprolinase subunit PxpA [Opitutaceae bacterium]|nr:5-oxoprolinase subunit PxpA [Opitutaceae bacterium]